MNNKIYQDVTDRIIAAMETGAMPWRKPWSDNTAANTPAMQRPLRANGVAYTGVNTVVLWEAALRKGYASRYWFTFKSALELGAAVRKGERSELAFYVGKWTPKDAADGAEDGEESTRDGSRTFLRAYNVFNADQIDNLPERFKPAAVAPVIVPETGRIIAADSFIDLTGATIRHGGNRACYIPSLDAINMPTFGQFETPAAYYSTAFHELIHWSGAESRLDRIKGFRWGDENYAAEELVAELGAAFICADQAISNECDQTAAYLKSWLKVLKNDPKAIFKASSLAERAAGYLNDTGRPAPAPTTPAPTITDGAKPAAAALGMVRPARRAARATAPAAVAVAPIAAPTVAPQFHSPWFKPLPAPAAAPIAATVPAEPAKPGLFSRVRAWLRPAAAPVAEPVAEPARMARILDEVAPTAAEPVAELPTAEPVAEPVAELPTAELPTAEPVAEPVAKPVAKPAPRRGRKPAKAKPAPALPAAAEPVAKPARRGRKPAAAAKPAKPVPVPTVAVGTTYIRGGFGFHHGAAMLDFSRLPHDWPIRIATEEGRNHAGGVIGYIIANLAEPAAWLENPRTIRVLVRRDGIATMPEPTPPAPAPEPTAEPAAPGKPAPAAKPAHKGSRRKAASIPAAAAPARAELLAPASFRRDYEAATAAGARLAVKTAEQCARAIGIAKVTACLELGRNWSAQAGASVVVTLPARLASMKLHGRTARLARDQRVPAARFWPGAQLPAAFADTAAVHDAAEETILFGNRDFTGDHGHAQYVAAMKAAGLWPTDATAPTDSRFGDGAAPAPGAIAPAPRKRTKRPAIPAPVPFSRRSISQPEAATL